MWSWVAATSHGSGGAALQRWRLNGGGGWRVVLQWWHLDGGGRRRAVAGRDSGIFAPRPLPLECALLQVIVLP
jgi:hypothetical protein